jgi:hypothetical protein
MAVQPLPDKDLEELVGGEDRRQQRERQLTPVSDLPKR